MKYPEFAARTRRAVSVLTLLALSSLFVVCDRSFAAEPPTKSTHMVAMRDGVRLETVVYRPADQEGPLPVIFARGPYGVFGTNQAKAFCGKGYVLVSQNMRGRFKSEGSDAVVYYNDGWGKRRDGHDSIEWITEQDWCDGNIATWGGSALGISQNMLAVDAPVELKAQFVMVAMSNMYAQCAYQGGAWRKSMMEHWLKGNKFDPESLETFLAHPKYDDFWAELNPEALASRAHAPAIFMGGWYDIFLQGTLNSFSTLHNSGGGQAHGNCRLVIGPYAHGGFKELKYPKDSGKRPAAVEAFRFFDHWLKGSKNGVVDDKPVHYYVMGDPEADDAPGNFWRSADNWPPPSEAVPYYLHADGGLSPNKPEGSEVRLAYDYDPKNPVRTVGGQNLFLPKGPADQRSVEDRPDVLLFTTDVLEVPVEVTGRIRAKLFVSSNCPDTDFTVKLTDVYPDGRSMLVTDGILRARYRKTFTEDNFLKPGSVYELDVDLWSTSLVFNKGHRIRIGVSSSNAPRFEPNPNTGKPFRADDETRIATNTVHVSQQHASHVILPVYSEQLGAGR